MLGCPTQISSNACSRFCFQFLYAIAPVEWCVRQTVHLDKNNGKAGCSALRTINVFEPLGKVHARTLWDRGSRNFFRDWAAGYAKHKSRITPILRRRVVKHRLCAAGVSHCDSFYDAANAFPSVYQQVCNFALTIHVGRWIVLFSKIESLRQYRCSSHLCFWWCCICSKWLWLIARWYPRWWTTFGAIPSNPW